jgi:hypothetical protein
MGIDVLRSGGSRFLFGLLRIGGFGSDAGKDFCNHLSCSIDR